MAGLASSGVSSRLKLIIGSLGLLLLLGFGLLWARSARDAAALREWQHELPRALQLARRHARPLHVHFTSPAAPLSARMNDTLALAPVQSVAMARFVNLRLDAPSQPELFLHLSGSAGALASVVVDVGASGQLDPVAVALGYLDAERYLMFLDGAAATLPRLRELRDGRGGDATAQLALGELYAAQGSLARARTVLESLRDVTVRARAVERLARLDLEAGHVAQARRRLDEARSLGLGADPLWLTEARLLAKERRVSEAVSLLSLGLSTERAPDEHASGLLLLAQLEHELKRDPEALTHLEQLRRDAPDSAWARLAVERIDHIKKPQPDHQH